MKLVNLIDEDFVNYYKPGMFLGFCFCSGKCNNEAGKIVCQNFGLYHTGLIDISAEDIVKRYRANPITSALILGGLEPFDSFDDVCELVKKFREEDPIKASKPLDPIVIYTGYYPFEIKDKINQLVRINGKWPLIIKFGRYIPGHKPHYDEILGVNLASDNQYAMIYESLDGYPCWCSWIS